MSKPNYIAIDPIDGLNNRICLFCHEPASHWLHRYYPTIAYCDPICLLCRDAWQDIKNEDLMLATN